MASTRTLTPPPPSPRVARYYGAGGRRGTVCQFLLGAAEKPDRDGEQPELFLSAGTISSGQTDDRAREMRAASWPRGRGC